MKGIVKKSTGSWFEVTLENGEDLSCKLKGKFRIQGIKSTNPIAVGDNVVVEISEAGEGIITKIEPRKNYIIRKSTNLSKQTHIIAANMDQAVLIISTANPKTPLGFVDRFLATAEAYDVPAVLVFNKIDMCDDDGLGEVFMNKAIYESIGYTCLETSATKKFHIEELKSLLKNKTSLVSGQSGVGKSTLINTVEPTLDLKTSEVSEFNEKGKHTTTFAEMFEFSFGGNIIDTPGIRSFGVVDFDKYQLSHYFREIFEASTECKFSDCVHINEPGCKVKALVEEGEIASSRYYSYCNIYNDEELENTY